MLLALPALGVLRRSLPEARLDWLVESGHARALQGVDELDEVIETRSGSWRRAPLAASTRGELRALAGRLRGARYDLALDLQGLWKSAAWARLSGAPIRFGLPPEQTRERSSGWNPIRRPGRCQKFSG